MDSTEMETLIKKEGWNYIPRPRYHQIYIYASRRFGKKMKEVYIGPQSRLDQLTEEQILQKLRDKK